MSQTTIQVSIRANGVPRNATAFPNTIIRDFLGANHMNPANNSIYLNGGPLLPNILDKSFEEAGLNVGPVAFSVAQKIANA